MPVDELHDYSERIHKTSAGYIYADGSEFDVPIEADRNPKLAVLEYDYVEFCGTVDVLAHEYGLGGCRSLTEYANMIDGEDLQLVEGLLFAIQRRYRAQSGETDLPEIDNKEDYEKHVRKMATAKSACTSKSFKNKWGYDSDMKDFLLNSGIGKKEVGEATEKLKSRQINKQEQNEFHDWLYKNVTPEKLRDPDFDLRGTYDKIRSHFDKCENFNISAVTINKGVR